jgi:hypothetical protein
VAPSGQQKHGLAACRVENSRIGVVRDRESREEIGDRRRREKCTASFALK